MFKIDAEILLRGYQNQLGNKYEVAKKTVEKILDFLIDTIVHLNQTKYREFQDIRLIDLFYYDDQDDFCFLKYDEYDGLMVIFPINEFLAGNKWVLPSYHTLIKGGYASDEYTNEINQIKTLLRKMEELEFTKKDYDLVDRVILEKIVEEVVSDAELKNQMRRCFYELAFSETNNRLVIKTKMPGVLLMIDYKTEEKNWTGREGAIHVAYLTPGWNYLKNADSCEKFFPDWDKTSVSKYIKVQSSNQNNNFETTL